MTNKEKIINKVLEYKDIIQHVKDNQRTENNELYRYATGLIQGLEFLTDMLIIYITGDFNGGYLK